MEQDLFGTSWTSKVRSLVVRYDVAVWVTVVVVVVVVPDRMVDDSVRCRFAGSKVMRRRRERLFGFQFAVHLV